VTGCLVENERAAIAEIEEVSLIVPNQKKELLIEELFPEEENLPEFSIDQFGGHTRAFVKVQDGCNSFCTYCTIPYVRGRSRSRRVEDILREVRTLIKQGYKEIVLTGINIGDFDGAPVEGEKGVRLAELVREVASQAFFD
jgi:threonylcarbamoyladenosine tRNA methylthiotransferase MtaB